MTKRIAAFLFVVAIVCAQAVRGPVFETHVPGSMTVYEINPGYLPSSTTTVVTGNIWLEELTLTNNTSAAVTVRVRDRQETPIPIVPDDLVIEAKTIYVMSWKARYAPSGVTWLASSTNAVVGTIRGKRLGQ